MASFGNQRNLRAVSIEEQARSYGAFMPAVQWASQAQPPIDPALDLGSASITISLNASAAATNASPLGTATTTITLTPTADLTSDVDSNTVADPLTGGGMRMDFSLSAILEIEVEPADPRSEEHTSELQSPM